MLLLSTMQVTVAMGAFSGGGRRILYLHANQLVPHTPCATAYSCNPCGQSLLELQANKEPQIKSNQIKSKRCRTPRVTCLHAHLFGCATGSR